MGGTSQAPIREAVDRLNAVVPANQFFTTSINGTITVTTDGQRLWVHAER
jgi:hypothetical protein